MPNGTAGSATGVGADGPPRVASEVTDGVTHVRLQRPDKLNALDPRMFEELVDVGVALSAREDVGAVVLRTCSS